MEPADRDLLLQFLWTRDETDRIDSAGKLKEWLVGLGLLDAGEPVNDEDVRLARHFRAATRGLCATNKGDELDSRTSETIDALNVIAPLQVTVQPGGALDIQPGGSGVARALSTFLALSYKATAEGEFRRFKTCQGCGWSFYDESRNGSKKWCDMGLCGTRSKMRAYRERKKAQG